MKKSTASSGMGAGAMGMGVSGSRAPVTGVKKASATGGLAAGKKPATYAKK